MFKALLVAMYLFTRGVSAYAAPPLATVAPGASQSATVVCSNGKMPFSTSTGQGAGVQGAHRIVFYCPRGATKIQLMLPGPYAGANETDSLYPVPTKLSIEVAPAPWDSTITYTSGQSVVWNPVHNGSSGSYANNPYWLAQATSTNSAPAVANTTNWTFGARPTAIPVTCGGQQDCSLATRTLPAGTVVTSGYRVTDAIPINCPVGCYVAVYAWINQSGAQLYTLDGHGYPMHLGGYSASGASQTDLTASGLSAIRSASNVTWSPVAIIGTLATTGPTVCIIGDSIADGIIGTGGAGSPTLISGGTGYAVGDILTVPNSGATIGAVAAGGSAKYIVSGISAGIINDLVLYSVGGYTSTSTQTGQTLPNGNQVLTGGSGSGATITATFTGITYDYGDLTGAQGYIQRALSAAAVPWSDFAATGDKISAWITRDYSRLSMIAATGCSSAIIGLGNNDYTSGTAAAVIEANLLTLSAQLKGLGIKKVLLATITPGSTSTTANGQSTLADQTANTNDSIRLAVNTWERTIPAGIDGVIDDTALVENGGSGAPTGKWSPIGGLPAAADGKHPGPSAVLLMVPSITSILGVLQ